MLNHRTRNNILLVITDQQRHDAVGYVTPWISTPNLDSLAARSIVCKAAYVQSPQCQPNRASLMTGRYPTSHRVWWNSINLPMNEKTIGNYLQNAGYKTAYFGKAHLNNNDKDVIKHFGFNQSFLYEDWLHLPINRKPNCPRIEYQTIMGAPNWAGRLSDRSVHHEDIITDNAISWLKQSGPKFTVVSFVGPHPPYAAPPPFDTYYNKADMVVPDNVSYNVYGQRLNNHQWRDLKTQYYGMISWIDDNIGRILEHVGNDTIIIFTSDHGDILGDHNLFSKGLFAYEGNTRVPLIIHHPDLGHIEYNHLVQTIDITPTILSAAGIGVHYSIQGKDLWPGFKENRPINEYVLSMIGFDDRIRMIRHGNFKYWISKNDEKLFDLENDPRELDNLTSRGGQFTNQLHQMRERLLRALISAEDPVPFPTS